jgi:integrase
MAWEPEEIAAYEDHWPVGTRQRVWFDVLRYTGLRRSDAVRLGRQHVRNGIATLRPEKTKANGIDVHVRILPALAETLAAGPIGDLAWIVGADGTPLTKESFGNMFRGACDAAGVTKSAHGLRKVAAETAAEAGATVNELEALFGWTGGKMASHYTKRANRQRLAAQAMDKIANRNVYRIDKSATQS